jgi:hypothetical protein
VSNTASSVPYNLRQPLLGHGTVGWFWGSQSSGDEIRSVELSNPICRCSTLFFSSAPAKDHVQSSEEAKCTNTPDVQAIQWIWPVPIIIGVLFAPESPWYVPPPFPPAYLTVPTGGSSAKAAPKTPKKPSSPSPRPKTPTRPSTSTKQSP